jgi:hypothetical protein
MELSDEQKKRIVEEESQRIAEEQYRESVRAELRSNKTAGQASSSEQGTQRPSLRSRILVTLLLAVALGIVIYSVANSDAVRRDAGSSPSLLRPFSNSLLSGSVSLSPQQSRWWKFEIGASAVNARVAGDFQARGGFGNDIEAIVAEWGECENWINGHQAHVLYSSGKVTNGLLDVPIHQAGTYCLAFSNRMGLISGKTVSGKISL